MKISEVAARAGLSVSTIRYYERAGLCPPIARGPDGRRRFSEADAGWLELLASLGATGMTMADMRVFAALYAGGDDTIAARKAALEAHRRSLDARHEELERCRALLNRKLALYDEKLEGRA